MIRFVVFVDHEIGYSTLEYLLRNYKEMVHAVVTTLQNHEGWWPSVLPLIEKHKIPFFTYPLNETALEFIKDTDYFFLLSWKHILNKNEIDLAKSAVINLHYSLLPKYRGVYPINRALIGGESETGISFHLVDSGVDTGRVVKQRSLEIKSDDTVRSLQLRMDELAYDLFIELINDIMNQKIEFSKLQSLVPRKEDYLSASAYQETNCLDLNKVMKLGDLINLLRGKTFFPNIPQAFFIDPITQKKVFLSVNLSLDSLEGVHNHEPKNPV